MKELYQRHELSIQNIFFSAPSKTAKLANSALFISSFSRHSASLWFVSLQKTFGMNDIQGWPHCSYSILLFHFPWSKLFSLNIQLFLLRSCGDLGQRFILHLIRNPGLKACILLAFRPQRFNIASTDMNSYHRFGDNTSFVPCEKRWWTYLQRPSITH